VVRFDPNVGSHLVENRAGMSRAQSFVWRVPPVAQGDVHHRGWLIDECIRISADKLGIRAGFLESFAPADDGPGNRD
jgi:hypothetical protein